MAEKTRYEIVKIYYQTGLWSEKKVRDAVVKGWITTAQFREITGKIY